MGKTRLFLNKNFPATANFLPSFFNEEDRHAKERLTMQKIKIITLLILFLAGCTITTGTPIPVATPDLPTSQTDLLTPLERARVALTAYLDALSHQNYERAAEYYGGDLELLSAYNPDLDPTDVPSLLKNGCELNGLMCLPPLDILKEETLSENRFAFTLHLVNRDGEVFEIGACCGADPEDVIPIREFVFEVEQRGAEFKVLTLPPYVP
jgi:hypothetical protein